MKNMNHVADHIKAVFFDHDDTLVATIEPVWKLHKHVAREHYGKDLTDKELHEHWGKPLKQMISLLYGTDNPETAITHISRYHRMYIKKFFDTTIPVLARLHKESKLIGVVTATSRQYLENDLDRHPGARELIDYTQVEDDTQFHKPDPRVFQPAITWLTAQEVKPEEVLYIGDSFLDAQAALQAGFNFLGVETGLVTARQFQKRGVISIPNLSNLLG